MLCGRTLGGGQQGSSHFHSRLRGGSGGLSHPLNWPSGVRADAGDDRGTVSPVGVDYSRQGAGDVHAGQGGLDIPGSKGGGGEEGGGDEAGGGDEEGEESSVDGVAGRSRLGKGRQLPQAAVVIAEDFAHDFTQFEDF